MKRVAVNNRYDIKQLLYCDRVLGVKDDTYRSFGGFQLWWYDRQHDTCHCCESRWSDLRKRVEHWSLEKAARILWHKRNALFLRSKPFSEDHKLGKVAQLCN